MCVKSEASNCAHRECSSFTYAIPKICVQNDHDHRDIPAKIVQGLNVDSSIALGQLSKTLITEVLR